MNPNFSKHIWREYLWYYAPLIFWIALILIISSGTGSMSNTSRFVRPLLEFLFPAATEAELAVLHGYLRKTGHFVGYSILGWLAARAFHFFAADAVRKFWYFFALVLAFVVAAVDETNQSFNAARTGSIYDVWLDTAGGAGGILIFAAMLQFFYRRRSGQDFAD